MIRRAYRAFAARDLETLRELSHAEVEIHTVTGVIAARDEPYRGHDGLESYLHDVSSVWDELELIPAEFHDLDDGGVLVFGRARARRGSTLVDSPTAWVWTLEDHRVTSARVFGDADAALALLNDRD